MCATSCAGGSAHETAIAPLLTAREQPDSCAPSPVPTALPAFAAIADSGTIAQALARVAPDVALRGAEFSVWIGPTGRVKRVVLLRPAFDTSSQVAADSVMTADVRGDSNGTAWPVRIRMTGGAVPTFEIDRSRFCPPVPLESGETSRGVVVERPITTPSELMETQDLHRAAPFRLRVLVDARGAVTQVEWLQHSGSAMQDRMAFTAAGERRFEPASLDGVPVPAWFEIRSEAH